MLIREIESMVNAPPPEAPEGIAAHVISTAEMKERDDSTDDTYEEAWFRLDPIDLKIVIHILSKSIDSLPKDEQVIVGQVIGCMALALARSEKQGLRDGIASGDTSAVLRAMKGKAFSLSRKQKRSGDKKSST